MTPRRIVISAVVTAGVIATTAVVVLAHHTPRHDTAAPPAMPTPPSTARPMWDLPAERALADRPMLTLPPLDAQPHALTTRTAGPAITLSARPYPRTPAGAIAQLKMLDEIGMDDGDPATYAQAYRRASLAGAPDPGTTGLSSVLTSFRATAGLTATGPVEGLSVNYDVTEGQVKGVLDGGRYVVACVLGELTVQKEAQVVTVGVGDCQAMRWTATGWRISPGALAAPAPCAWPGSAESVAAGYRELR
jgi:hypothetical protein